MSVQSTYDFIKKRLAQGGREVSFMSFDLKQEVFENAAKSGDVSTMLKLIKLSDKQRATRK